MEVLVFSNNEYVSIKVPVGLDGKEYYFASIFAHLVNERGMIREKALQISEAAAFKKLYPGIVYGKQLEDEILSVFLP